MLPLLGEAPTRGSRRGRSGVRASRRMWPALCRVVRYGRGLPIEAMKRKRRGVLRGGGGDIEDVDVDVDDELSGWWLRVMVVVVVVVDFADGSW